jgi:beta-aspartyl-peptidase (threonine type)
MNSVAAAPVLLVHGGAGVIRRDMDAATERAVRAALAGALRRGHATLAAGGPALDAVTAAVVVLEDSPHFNAGHGAVFTHDGDNELDAATMDGATLRAGAVAGVRHVRNPVLLARAVMEHSPHVMLAGEGAEAFARGHDIAMVDADYFRTERRWRELQEAQRQASRNQPVDHFGTVGAVALDANGCLAAATSTGGMTDKRWGRIGDSPLIGAGTYANAACAMSGTGWGEFYIRTAAAHAVCMRVAAMRQSVQEAAEAVINEEIPALGGSGGAIVLGADGTFAMPFNTDGMFRGHVGNDGEPRVAIWPDERV